MDETRLVPFYCHILFHSIRGIEVARAPASPQVATGAGIPTLYGSGSGVAVAFAALPARLQVRLRVVGQLDTLLSREHRCGLMPIFRS